MRALVDQWRCLVCLYMGLSGPSIAMAAEQYQSFVEDCGLEPPGTYRALPVPRRPHERQAKSGAGREVRPEPDAEPPAVRRERGAPVVEARAAGAAGVATLTGGAGAGALAGKVVYLSPGHGFTYLEALKAWRTQRGNTHDVVEDLVSAETLSELLVPMLEGAGATVVTVRESDVSRTMHVVDDVDATLEGALGGVRAGPPGFSALGGSLVGSVNPFASGGTQLLPTTPAGDTSAHFVPTFAKDEALTVYVSYHADGARATDAHYIVHHAGGDAHFRVNQRRHGSTWVRLGRFFFRAGRDRARGAVELKNDSLSGGNVSLDAVRFGGGVGLSDRGGGTSGRPRYEECARYHAQFSGAPPEVYANAETDRSADPSARPRFAAWHREEGEDAIYVAWHTNAADGTARGSEFYVYGPNDPNGSYQFTGVPGSDVLAQRLREELTQDLRALPEHRDWRDRGVRSGRFAELNPAHNAEMPAVLVEVAFHDAEADAAALRSPRFRLVAARAFLKAILRYFAGRDGRAVLFPPDPPVRPRAFSGSGGGVVVSWDPAPGLARGGGPATSYRVYVSADGRAFDEGTEVEAPPFTVSLRRGERRYFRVTALNAAGESLPTVLVGAFASGGPAAQALIVNAFDRLDAELAGREDLGAFDLGAPWRVLLAQMNDGSQIARHGEALVAASVSFDSATVGAFLEGGVPSAPVLLDWISGRGRAGALEATALERDRMRAHVAEGGALVFSGAEETRALWGAEDAGRAFAQETFGVGEVRGGPVGVVTFAGHKLAGPAAYSIRGSDGDGPEDEDGAGDGYRIAGLARFGALAREGVEALATLRESGELVAIGQRTHDRRTAALGFPLELLGGPADRAEVMGGLLRYLGVEATTEPAREVVLTLSPDVYPAQQGGCRAAGGPLGLAWALLFTLAVRRSRQR